MNPPAAATTLAIATCAGALAQAFARRVELPGIVLLLAVGFFLGHDGLGVVQTEVLGDGLHILVGFAVAVILFEGGLQLDFRRLRRQARPIRRLVTLGAVVTFVGGTLLARYVMVWPWQQACLFGSLVIVTGPTVITPMVRRLSVTHRLGTILEAEGVFIDAVGAIVAVVALELALGPQHLTLWDAALHAGAGLGAGCLLGSVVGFLIARVLHRTDLIDDGIRNVLVLSIVMMLFAGANALVPESGVAAVTVAGLVAGNMSERVVRGLRAFKEQLTSLFIGMLFILLAADVRLGELAAVGLPGLLTVGLLIVLVRPLAVWLSTSGSDLGIKERVFIAWIGPRGIVAAAVASLFAARFAQAGLTGGRELRALVFVVISSTVVWSGLTGGLIARLFGLKRPKDSGWLIFGAHPVATTMARLLSERCDEDDAAVCIDSDPNLVLEAEAAGVRSIMADAFRERTQRRVELDTRTGTIALTDNESANLLFVEHTRPIRDGVAAFTAINSATAGVTSPMATEAGARTLAIDTRHLQRWNERIRRGRAKVEAVSIRSRTRMGEVLDIDIGLPLVVESKNQRWPATSDTLLDRGMRVFMLRVTDSRAPAAQAAQACQIASVDTAVREHGVSA